MWNDIVNPLQNLNCAAVEGREGTNNSYHALLSMWLLIHAQIKVKPYYKDVTSGIVYLMVQKGMPLRN